jgi:PPOX class probable F420-dependent enzyme
MAGHIPWNKVDLWLRAHRSIWLATTRPDGRPHAAPVWYVWEEPGQRLYFQTVRTSRKGRNLARQPWVVAHLLDGDDTLILEGPAAIVTDPDERARIEAAYGDKYVDPHSGARAAFDNPADDLWRLDVKRIMAWEYGVVATRTDWTF